MVEFIVFKGFLVAIALGALIGLEREMEQQTLKRQDFAGLRTFTLITLLGAITGFLSRTVFNSYMFVIIVFLSLAALGIISYYVLSNIQKKIGATTQITVMLAFVLGVMCTIGYASMAIIFTVIIATFLAFKGKLHGFAKKIEKNELFATIEFAIVSIVVLPFLPNKNFSPMDIPYISKVISSIPSISTSFVSQINVFNPYKIWLMVVFISGLSLVGYLLIKYIGTKKGIGMTGFLGGLVSSTAVSSTMSAESKKHKRYVNPFVFATVIASSMMFIRIIIEVLVINNKLLLYVFVPMFVMAIVGLIAAIIFWKNTKNPEHDIEFETPFALAPALKFGLFFALVLVVAKIANLLFGNAGVYVASLLSGLADVDAITLSMASLAAAGDLTLKTAGIAITIAAASNTIVKGFIAYLFGAKEFAKKIILVFSIIPILGLIVAFLL